jgi:hypothetical protein
MKWLLALSTILGVVSASPALAQVWAEAGDAGDLPATAQNPIGAGPLAAITGALPTGTDGDLYCIRIDNPQAFTATTCNTTVFDTQLWLFRPDGNGVSHNDDDPGGCGLQSTLTGAFVGAAGSYLLGISGYNRDPNGPNGLIWLNTPFNVERAPDGPGAPGPVISWGGTGGTGTYRINLTGVSYCEAATSVEPTTWGSIKGVYRR